MFGLSATELIIILVIVLIIFGAGKLPNVMKELGKGVKNFKGAMTEVEDESADKPEPKVIQGEVKKDA